jgi:hypothetical protein
VSTVPLRCRCGAVRGSAANISPRTGNRVVCYCKDCQAFARFLERDDVVDRLGGTDIFQVAPSQVRIAEGADELRCMRLSEKGLVRWYTGCCRTPIGNTVGGGFPFVGLIGSFIDVGDGSARDAVLGKPLGYIFGSAARGGCPPGAHAKASIGVLLRIARLVIGWWVRGAGFPSPFFDKETKASRVVPRVLSVAERAALTGAVP